MSTTFDSPAGVPAILAVEVSATARDRSVAGIAEIGAVWLTGPRAGEEFAQRCRPRLTSVWYPGFEEVRHADWLEDEAELTEAEALRSFLLWVGEDSPVLAGWDAALVRLCLAKARDAHFGPVVVPPLPFVGQPLDLATLAFCLPAWLGGPWMPHGVTLASALSLTGLPPLESNSSALHRARALAALGAVLARVGSETND